MGGDSDVRVGWGVSWLVAVYDISYCSVSHNYLYMDLPSTWAVSLSDSGVGESPGAWAVSDGQGGGLNH